MDNGRSEYRKARVALRGQVKDALRAKENFSKVVRIMLIGETGAGKSSTINSIFGRQILREGGSPMSNTGEITPIRVVEGPFVLEFIDTPGIGENRTPQVANQQWTSLLKYASNAPPDCILFLFNPLEHQKGIGGAEIAMLRRAVPLIDGRWSRVLLVATHGLGIGKNIGKLFDAATEFRAAFASLSGVKHLDLPLEIVENAGDKDTLQTLEHALLSGEQRVPGRTPWLRSLIGALLRIVKDDAMAAFILSMFLDPLEHAAVHITGPGGDGSIIFHAELKRAENVLERFWQTNDPDIISRLAVDWKLASSVIDQARGLLASNQRYKTERYRAVVTDGAPKTRALLKQLKEMVHSHAIFTFPTTDVERSAFAELKKLFYKASPEVFEKELSLAGNASLVGALLLDLLEKVTPVIVTPQPTAPPSHDPLWRGFLAWRAAQGTPCRSIVLAHDLLEPILAVPTQASTAERYLHAWLQSLPADYFNNLLSHVMKLLHERTKHATHSADDSRPEMEAIALVIIGLDDYVKRLELLNSNTAITDFCVRHWPAIADAKP